MKKAVMFALMLAVMAIQSVALAGNCDTVSNASSGSRGTVVSSSSQGKTSESHKK